MWKIIWKAFLLMRSNSALQSNTTPLSTVQWFEEGDMGLGDSLLQDVNWPHLNTPPSQNLLQLDELNQDEIINYITHDDLSPYILQIDDQNKPFSYFEEGYQGHQSSQHESLYNNLDTYWNAYSHLQMFSQPDPLDSCLGNPVWEIEKTIQQRKDMIHETSTSKTDLYKLLDSDIETLQPYKKPKLTGYNIHDKRKNLVPILEGCTYFETPQYAPYISPPHHQASISQESNNIGYLLPDPAERFEAEKKLQETQDSPDFPNMALYSFLDPLKVNCDPHTGLENMCSSIIDSQEYSLPGKGRAIEMDMAQSVTPQVQSCLQDSISKQPYTLNNMIKNPSNIDGKRQFFQESQSAQYESLSSHTNLHGCFEKSQFNFHPHNEFKPTCTTIDEINSPMNAKILSFTSLTRTCLQASVSKGSRVLGDSIQDPSYPVKNLPRDLWMEKYNMGVENLHINSLSHQADIDGRLLLKGLTREEETENATRASPSPSDFIDIHVLKGNTHSSGNDIAASTSLVEAINIPPEIKCMPKGSISIGNHDPMGIKEKLNPSHSASVIGLVFAEKLMSPGSSRVTSNQLILALQRIGAFMVNMSPVLCYETTVWFEKLHKEMIQNNSEEKSAVELINLAIKLSHLKITMCFLGIIGVFANNGGDQLSLEILLKEGWEFLKLHFEEWRNLNVNDKNENQVKRKDFNKPDWKDPILWFHYLSRLSRHAELAVDSIYHLMNRWDDQQTTSKINAKHLSWYRSEIKVFHDSHLKYIHGGFYGRGEIRNIAFRGVKLSGKYTMSPCGSEGSWYKIYKFLSYSAQFHSSVGFDMCQEVHNFFVSLLEHMMKFQNGILNDDITYAVKIPGAKKLSSHRKPADENVEKIVKVISLAEYRVTVGFIGLVRVLYQNELPVVTLRLVLKSAWEFLQGIFSQWADFQFEKNLPQNLNRQCLNKHRITLDYTDPNELFNVLWQFQVVSRNPVPLHCLPRLLKSWNNDLANLKKLHPNDYNFEIKALLGETPLSWSKLLE
ncbi:uncharacterized protein MELLADRAFT_102995 [Melampsora larici-populina 98AG31]|uniref:Uncharacterized protein n=1 Tax=Melampsora larici-populina (strain 98AG31 / pathotype 3-4-7) TaxID=747676 RepID=F4RA77_MELLP|nr:uncharacterized protein MELLADRAFT_102995 [Melampsora larici-populina 98AG31]EGG10828.1 hypothetical protein MELLADRAFT_102995 [Melampsora larici-populina 98AG31]